MLIGRCTSQRKHIKDVLDRFNMANAQPVLTPLAKSSPLMKEDCPQSPEELDIRGCRGSDSKRRGKTDRDWRARAQLPIYMYTTKKGIKEDYVRVINPSHGV